MRSDSQVLGPSGVMCSDVPPIVPLGDHTLLFTGINCAVPRQQCDDPAGYRNGERGDSPRSPSKGSISQWASGGFATTRHAIDP